MTHRLYYTDAYLREFEASVVEIAADGTRVYLESTAFYPTSGGQPHDTGLVDDVLVRDVVDEGDRIAHILERPLSGRARARGTIDWPRRFDHMQQHTGQHLLSAVFADLFGMSTVSVHFGDAYATMDLSAVSLSPEQLSAAEERANQIVVENRAVAVSFEEGETATGLRKASDRIGVLRVVTIEGLDRSACGGTHVAATGQIGAILVRDTERIRDAIRVQFRCGGRAINRARADYQSVARIAAAFSCSIDEASDLAAKQGGRLRESEQRTRRLEREIAGLQAQTLYAATPESSDGVRRIVLPATDELEMMRAVAQALMQSARAIVVGGLESPPTLLLATSADSGVDAGKLLREVIAQHGGRGGGSARLAQGSLPNAEALRAAIARATRPPA